MTPSDLSPTMRKAYEALPENERAAFLEEYAHWYGETVRGNISRVLARNFSHNVGKHVTEAQ